MALYHKIASKPALAISLAVAAIFLSLLLGIVLDFFVSRWSAEHAVHQAVATAQQQTERSFCSIINLQVQALKQEQPAPGNPSRQILYQAYQDFLGLQKKFGC